MSEQRLKGVLVWGGAALAVLFCLAPCLYMALVAVVPGPQDLAPGGDPELTLDHLRTVLTAESLHFPAYLRNSLIVATATAIVSVVVGSLAAYALTRLDLPGRGVVLMVVLALSMFPPISMVGYLYRLMTALGWINSYPALVGPYVAWTLPLCVWILVSYFARIPRDLDRAALVDGCTRLGVLTRVIWPVAAPGLFSTAILAFIFAFNEFLFALMLTTDHRARTVPVGIARFEGMHGQVPWGEVMAAATVTTLPIVVLALIFQRRIVQGLTHGAIKG